MLNQHVAREKRVGLLYSYPTRFASLHESDSNTCACYIRRFLVQSLCTMIQDCNCSNTNTEYIAIFSKSLLLVSSRTLYTWPLHMKFSSKTIGMPHGRCLICVSIHYYASCLCAMKLYSLNQACFRYKVTPVEVIMGPVELYIIDSELNPTQVGFTSHMNRNWFMSWVQAWI